MASHDDSKKAALIAKTCGVLVKTMTTVIERTPLREVDRFVIHMFLLGAIDCLAQANGMGDSAPQIFALALMNHFNYDPETAGNVVYDTIRQSGTKAGQTLMRTGGETILRALSKEDPAARDAALFVLDEIIRGDYFASE